MGAGMADVGTGEEIVTIDGVELRIAVLGGHASEDRLLVVKPRDAIDEYLELLDTFAAPNIVELGIAYGGSVALSALGGRPSRMVALDMATARIPLLDRILAEKGLADRVTLHFGVDQADRATVTRIVDEAFGADPLDLVVDDASHLYGPTVASFEVLFPRLRPGGRYLIEDWSCDHEIRSFLARAHADEASPFHDWSEGALSGDLVGGPDGQRSQTEIAVSAVRHELGRSDALPETPLSRLGLELVHGIPEQRSGIASVVIGPHLIEVVRDATPLPAGYSLADACPDHFATLRAPQGASA